MHDTSKRTTRKRQVRKEQIFRAALEIFGKYGYKKATLEDIANSLDMTKSSLYRYFMDKRTLYEESVSYGLKKWQQTSALSIEQEEDPVAQLKNYAISGMTYLNTDPDLKNVILNDPAIFPLNTKEDPFADINRESMEILKNVLKRGIEMNRFRNCNVDSTASFLYSVYVMFIIKSYVKSDIESVDDVMTTALDTILYGIVRA